MDRSDNDGVPSCEGTGIEAEVLVAVVFERAVQAPGPKCAPVQSRCVAVVSSSAPTLVFQALHSKTCSKFEFLTSVGVNPVIDDRMVYTMKKCEDVSRPAFTKNVK